MNTTPRMTSITASKKQKRAQNVASMAIKHEVIEIGDSSPSPVGKSTPLKSVFCLKNREEIKKFEEQEDCFILEFDPYDGLDGLRLPWTENEVDAEAELIVVGEKGQVLYFRLLNAFPTVSNFNFGLSCTCILGFFFFFLSIFGGMIKFMM